jgi:glycosyltransferase involved in cell wall biosynthesis
MAEQAPTILQIIPRLDTGGAELSTIEIAEAIVRAGGRALIATEGGRMADRITAVGGEILTMPVDSKNPATILANARRMAGLVRTRGVALLHARSRAPAWSALIAARRTGVPFVTTYHGIYGQKTPLKGWYNGVMARGDIVIANSHYTAEIVRSRHKVADEKLRVIPRCADLDRVSPDAVAPARIKAIRGAWGVATDARLVVLAARMTRWKGQLVAIEAASQVLRRPEYDDVIFVLAGDDQGRAAYRSELESRISELGLGGRIIIPGHSADMPAAFAAAALALVPSIEAEAFGRISVEAQAMGCPVIVSDSGALPETIVTPKDASSLGLVTGWTFRTGDAGELAARIASALSLPVGQGAAMAASAQRHVAAHFSKTGLQRATLSVYDELLGGRLAAAFDLHGIQNEDLKSSASTIPASFV